MLLRERPRARAAVMPAPALLPSLRDALARRTAIFGPVEVDEALTTPRGLRQALGAALRRIADLLEPRR